MVKDQSAESGLSPHRGGNSAGEPAESVQREGDPPVCTISRGWCREAESLGELVILSSKSVQKSWNFQKSLRLYTRYCARRSSNRHNRRENNVELVPPQDGGNESPTKGWAQFLLLGLFLALLALRARSPSALFLRPMLRAYGSVAHNPKIPSTPWLAALVRIAKVCGLGNLGVDFPWLPNFNRLE